MGGQNQIIEDLTNELGDLAPPSGYFVGLHIRFAAPPLMTFQTYPQAWTDHYTQHAYALRDPLIAWGGISRTGATRWCDIDIPDPFDIMAEARKFGLVYGGVSISCGPMTSRTVAGGIARADREFTDEEIAELSGIILRLHTETEPPDNLTGGAEIEALKVVGGAGERYAAGAARLGISESALKARLTSARRKLFARTSAEAIQRAKDYRLI